MPQTWGYLLDAPGRPAPDRQRELLALHGVNTDAKGTMWADTFHGRTSRPAARLTERSALLVAVLSGDSVVVAAPECLGLTEADAAAFVADLAEKGVRVIVNGGSVVLEPGEPAGELLDAVRRFVHAQTVRRYRRRKSD